MSTMQTRLGDARNWIENHRAQALAVLILLAAIASPSRFRMTSHGAMLKT